MSLRLACMSAGLVALAACGRADEDIGMHPSMHTTGEIDEPNAPWLWANDTEDELASAQTFPLVAIPTDHPMTVRLQFWISAIDQALREQLPGRLTDIPSPRVLVRFSRELGAEAHRINVAFAVPGRSRSAPSNQVAEERSTLMVQPNGTVFGSRDPSPAPLARPASATTIREFVRYFTEGLDPCRIEGDERGVTFGTGCQVIGPPVSTRVGFTATSRFLTITTGLLARIADEEKVVAILAHELGHFYRAHLSVPKDRLNYLYSRDTVGAVRPLPDARFERETAAARALARNAPSPMTLEQIDELIVAQHLGLYTTEQEADEMSVELLARVGIPPRVAVEAILATQKLVEELHSGRAPETERSDSSKGIPWAECTSLRDRGFRDAHGAEVVVPVGSIADAHHSFCFRAWNLEREVEAHGYAVANRASPPGPSWESLVAQFSASP